jgi:uracil-DNA glycosylase
MKFKQLESLNERIRSTKEPGISRRYKPVVNALFPTQRFLIVSSDPSSDTNKLKDLFDKHSDFEERVLALFFFGRDDEKEVLKIRTDYRKHKEIFLKTFYWTHFSKVYAAGNPGKFWADRFLLEEIELFEPQAIILFGNTAADFLLGKGKLKERVNKVIDWKGVPVLCTLHPSKDWNLRRRNEFDFHDTWKLIRKTTGFDKNFI